MTLTMKRRTVLKTGAAAATLLAAPALAQGRARITVWNQASQMQAGIENFAAANPDIEVDLVQIGTNDLHQNLLVSLATESNLPDVTSLLMRRAPEFLDTGMFLPVDDALAPHADGFTDDAAFVRRNGVTYGYVMGPGNMAIWMNAAALSEHGIDVATLETWPDMVAAAERLQEASGGSQYLMVRPLGTSGFNYFNAFFHGRGGNWWTEAGAVNTADQALATETLEWYVAQHEAGLAMDLDMFRLPHYEALRDRSLLGFGMNYTVGANNIPREAPDQSGDWRMVTWPRWTADAPKRTGAWGGILYAGLAQTEHPEAVKRFLTWWLEPGQGLVDHINAQGLALYQPALDLPEATAPNPYFGGQQLAVDLARVPYPAFNYFHWGQTEEIGANAIERAIDGGVTAAEAMADMFDELGSIRT